MHKHTLALALLLLSSVAVAAPSLGELQMGSSPNDPFKAEVRIDVEHASDLAQLRAGVLSRQARAGGAQQAWEQELSYRLEDRADGYHLVIESSKPVKSRKLELTIGVEDATGASSRDYVFEYKDKSWMAAEMGMSLKLSALNTIPSGPAAPAADSDVPTQKATAGQHAGAGLKLSSDLHFVVPFAEGRITLGPKGRDAVDRLAEVATNAERIQIKGWAGGDKPNQRESIAFNRAYTVKAQLARKGVSKDNLRIMRPSLALSELDAQGIDSPQVVATLLMNGDEEKAAAE